MSASNIRTVVKSFAVSLLLLSVVSCAAIDGQESAGEYLDDATITTKVKAAFIADAHIKSFQISVETMEGVVQLSGFVDSADSETRAVHLAEAVHGVKSVKDSIAVAPKQAN